MKVKRLPEDFQVEEITDIAPGGAGAYALYRLTKRGWTTHDALGVVRRRWNLDRLRISYGGLKDRHALTTQFFTVVRGPRRTLSQQGIEVEYLGQVERPFTSADIRANAFRITLRALTAGQLEAAATALDQVRETGLPNYFDDQRFGSVGAGGRFVAREIVLGRYEQALQLALAEPYEHDRSAQKKEKALLRQHWGDWARCKELLPRSHARSLVDYLLHHPDDFRGALERLNPDLRGLYLSAYQSYLWNDALARWITVRFEADAQSGMSTPPNLFHVSTRLRRLPVPTRLDSVPAAELAALSIPLPSPRVVLVPGDPISTALEHAMLHEEITPDQLRLRGFKKMFFSRGERAAWYFPAEISYNSDIDEMEPSRHKLLLAFELPRGCYATLLLKRLATT